MIDWRNLDFRAQHKNLVQIADFSGVPQGRPLGTILFKTKQSK